MTSSEAHSNPFRPTLGPLHHPPIIVSYLEFSTMVSAILIHLAGRAREEP